jgi:hypothetical protein
MLRRDECPPIRTFLSPLHPSCDWFASVRFNNVFFGGFADWEEANQGSPSRQLPLFLSASSEIGGPGICNSRFSYGGAGWGMGTGIGAAAYGVYGLPGFQPCLDGIADMDRASG